MAIKNIIARGIGFTPGSVKFIPTHGFSVGALVVPTAEGLQWTPFIRRAHYEATESSQHYTPGIRRQHWEPK